MADVIDGGKRTYGEDLTGRVFRNWLVIGPSEIHVTARGKRVRRWFCECGCGSRAFVEKGVLTQRSSWRCQECERGQNTYNRPSLKEHPLYDVYFCMISRCFSERSRSFCDYGGRGITVEEPWRSSKHEFFADMIPGWSHGMTLERIDNNGNYCKSNCRWATHTEQANNRRSNHRITWNGETKTIFEWEKSTGISADKLRCRSNRGMPPEKIFFIGDLPKSSFGRKRGGSLKHQNR